MNVAGRIASMPHLWANLPHVRHQSNTLWISSSAGILAATTANSQSRAPTRAYSPASQGYFTVILEELFDTENDYQSRYYHLTNGDHFEHPPCLLHLMQILPITNHHNLMLCRSVLPAASLYQLSHLSGLIPDWLMKTKPHALEADQEFWELCANNAQ
jgi:hypothetical protein